MERNYPYGITGNAQSVTFDEPVEIGSMLDAASPYSVDFSGIDMTYDSPKSRNNPNSTYQTPREFGLRQTPYDPAFEKKMREAEFNAKQKYYDDQQMFAGMTAAGQSSNYAGMGAGLGMAWGGGIGSAIGGGLGLGLDLAMQYQNSKKQKRLEEQQRMIAKKQERIENAERLRQRQMSNAEMGMLASDKELADRKFNEAQALKFRQALNNVTNQKMARLGINPYGPNGYQASDMGGVRVNPNRAYGIMGNAGLDVVRA